jgi:hypothetical protein
LPMLTSDMGALRQEARDLGVTLTTEDAAAAAKLGDAFDRVNKTIRGAFQQIGASVAPVLTRALDSITQITAASARWMRENRAIVVAVAGIGAGLAVVGTVVGSVGVGVVALGAAISAVGSVVGTVATVLAAVGGAPMLAAIAGAVAGWTAIGAAVGYVFHQAGLLQPVLDWLGQSFSRVFGVAQQTIGGVVSALSSGQWGRAAEIGWTGVKLAVLVGSQQVLKGIDGLWNNAGQITTNFFKSLASLVYNVFSSLPKIAWAALKGGVALQAAINGVISNAFASGGMDLASGLDSAIARTQARMNQLTAQERTAVGGRAAAGVPAAVIQPAGVAAASMNRQAEIAGPAAPAGALTGGGNGQLAQLLSVSEGQLVALRRLVAMGGLT